MDTNSHRITAQIPYEYHNLPIPGGGYVTGFLFSKKEKNVLYARTDIGGTYRFDYEKKTWVSLIPHVTMEDLSETYPIAIALDEDRPGSLYIACGENRPGAGVLAVSKDYGGSFRYEKIPALIHGNLNGRGTGERLFVEGSEIFFASQRDGLLHSTDDGHTWTKLSAMEEQYLTFVTRVRGVLVVGTAGVSTADRSGEVAMRGHCLYASCDNGQSFLKMPVPANRAVPGCRFHGLAAQRWAADDRFLYVTFASTGRNSYVLEEGYSCDSGDNIDGHIVRYALDELAGIRENGAGEFGIAMQEITPGSASPAGGIGQEHIEKGAMLEYGFSGISVSGQTPGMLVATTIVKYDGDSVFLSFDYGATWKQILYDLAEGEMVFRAPYMRPECNGGHCLIHWLSDFRINPFDDNEGWFNSGTGVFRTVNLKDEVCRFTDWCDGIEETVHLNVYSCPAGKTQVIDIVGDLGGFAFEDIDTPCGNSFADAQGNRYITCINADFSDLYPERLVVTPRGNWTGKTFGGLILSKDQGKTFERLALPYGLTKDLDEAFRRLETPNVNSGWVAMSPDAGHIVWSVAEGIDLPVERVIVSHDAGRTFSLVRVFDLQGKQKTTGHFKCFSDRMDSSLFYGFGGASDFYISHDSGQTFRQYALPEDFPEIEFGLIDCANKTEVRGETGKRGVFYMAVGKAGIWKLCYDADADSVRLTKLTQDSVTAYRLGLGLIAPGADYARDPKAIYFNGIVDGSYGFYRSFDDCATYERINTQQQMFGEINSIDGDCRTFGRFYLATGSNGLKYGQQV